VARGCGKLLLLLLPQLLLLLVVGEVRLVMQLRTMTGRKPWKLAAPVTSMMVLSLGKLGFLSRWMIEVRDLRAAALGSRVGKKPGFFYKKKPAQWVFWVFLDVWVFFLIFLVFLYIYFIQKRVFRFFLDVWFFLVFLYIYPEESF
jgi:hypothetical protein